MLGAVKKYTPENCLWRKMFSHFHAFLSVYYACKQPPSARTNQHRSQSGYQLNHHAPVLCTKTKSCAEELIMHTFSLTIPKNYSFLVGSLGDLSLITVQNYDTFPKGTTHVFNRRNLVCT